MPDADRPVSLTSLIHSVALRVVEDLDARIASTRDVSAVETMCMVLGLGGMALAMGVTVAQATLPDVLQTEDALRRAVVEAGFDASICPDGWAADHAALLPLTEAEVTAWYLSESLQLSDKDVIAAVGLYLTSPRDFRQIQGPALTRNQILLCIAESRRLTTPLNDMIPPELRPA